MSSDLIIDPEHFDEHDLDDPEATKDEIEFYLPHRGVMAQLDAIIASDTEEDWFVGYRQVEDDEFWTTGHFPQVSVMPGVLRCEAAAQACGYYSMRYIDDELAMAFTGIDDATFRDWVIPPDELYVLGRLQRLRRPLIKFDTQVVTADDHTAVYEGVITGMLQDHL